MPLASTIRQLLRSHRIKKALDQRQKTRALKQEKENHQMLEQLKLFQHEELTTLCEACIHALQALLEPTLLGDWRTWRHVTHHRSFTDLRNAAECQGCKLCHLLFDAVKTELQERYSTEDDFLPQLIEECDGEPPFAFQAWTANLDLEVCPRGEGLDFLRYAAYREVSGCAYQGINYHGYYPGIKLSVQRLAGAFNMILGREVASMPNYTLAKEWIATCRDLHAHCPKMLESKLPSRVIDLGPTSAPENTEIVLREGLELKAHYVALSHCWGLREPCLMLTKDSKDDMLQRIRYEDLEKNFQDAIDVTRVLGYRYLWIDTLCIIQGDDADWVKQSARMENVYGDAVVTIAAVNARDAYAGFLHVRQNLDSNAAPIRFRLTKGKANVVAQISNRPSNWPSKRIEGVLNGRAWAFQERHISSRTLYFTEQKMFFECNSSEHHESLHYPITGEDGRWRHELLGGSILKPTPVDSAKELERCVDNYYNMIWTYSKCSLSKVNDRLPAMSAIARRYERRTGDTYLAGIWHNSIADGLAWERARPRNTVENFACGTSVPSWSWASCKTTIELNRVVKTLVTLEDFKIVPKTSDTFGDVEEGVLKVTGNVVNASISHRVEKSSSGTCFMMFKASYNVWENHYTSCLCDDTQRCARIVGGEEDVLCLLIGLTVGFSPSF